MGQQVPEQIFQERNKGLLGSVVNLAFEEEETNVRKKAHHQLWI